MSEKIKTQTFDELREQITPDQRWVLSKIWNHYLEKDEWMLEQVLYHPSQGNKSKETISSAIKSLKGLVIGVNDKRGTRYRLTLPGVLLSDRGKEVEGIISFYLKYLRCMYGGNPDIESIKSQDLVDEKRISKDWAQQLGKLILLSGFLSGGSFSLQDAFGEEIKVGSVVGVEWSADVPAELLPKLSEIKDFPAYIRERAMEEYDPDLPVDETERVFYKREETLGGKAPSKEVQEGITYTEYVNSGRIEQLRGISSEKFDLKKLIRLCKELNICYRDGCFFAVAILVRVILDHVPPIFGCEEFKEVANNYGNGGKSFRESMQNLENSSRKIADRHLHKQICRKEPLPNKTQVNFSNDLDVLLEEIVRIL